MNGLENITARIAADAQAEAQTILAEAQSRAQAITGEWAAQAKKESDDILARGKAAADERRERLESVAQMEGKKLLLSARQEMIGKAFDRALEKLLSLPEEEYITLLANLCAKAAVTGREEVIFDPNDQKKVGAKVVMKANEILAKQVAPQLPDEMRDSAAGAILDTVVTVGSALMKGTAMLTVADETRPIKGGFILSDQGVEVNCAFDTLVRLSRPQLERQVAQILFED